MQQNSNQVPEFDDAQLERALRRTYEQAQQAEGAERERLMQIGRNIAAERRRRRAFSEIDVSRGGASPLARAEMAGLDTEEERMAAFRLHYPQGEFFGPSVTTGNRAVFRPAPGEPLQYVDPTFEEQLGRVDLSDYPTEGNILEKFGALTRAQGQSALGLGEVGQEAFELLGGDAPALTAEGLGLAALSRTGPGRAAMAARPVAVGALVGMGSGLTGGTLEQGIQYVRGTQRQTLPEQAQTISLETALAGTGGAAGGVLGTTGPRVIEGVAESGTQQIGESGRRAVQSFGELSGGRLAESGRGRLGLIPSQVSDNQALQALTSAASKIFPRLGRYQQEQRQVLIDSLDSLRAVDDLDTARPAILGQYERLLGSFRSGLRNVLGQSGVSPREGGRALTEARQIFARDSQEVVGALYDSARTLAREADERGDPVTFNVNSRIVVDGEEVLDPQSLLGRAQAVYDEMSRPVRRPDPRTGEYSPEPSIPLANRRFAEQFLIQVEELPPDATVDELRSLAQNLFDAAQPGADGVTRAPQALASALRREVMDTLSSPVSGDAAVVRAYQDAANAASARFDNLEMADIVDLYNRGNNARFYQTYQDFTQPNAANVDRLETLQRILTSEEGSRQGWATFREAFRTDLASDVGNLPARLAAYQDTPGGMDVLRRLLTPDQINNLEALSARVARLQDTRVTEIAQTEEASRQYVDRLLSRGARSSGQSQAIVEFLEESAGEGWRTSAAGRALRAGVIENYIRRVRQTNSQGNVVVNPRRVREELENLRRTGASRFLTDADMQVLNNIDNVVFFVEALGADVGTSLVARQEVNQLFNNPNILKTMASLAPYMTFGRLMTSESVQRVMNGTGRPMSDSVYAAQRYLWSLSDDLAVRGEEDEYQALERLRSFYRGGDRAEELSEPSRLSGL